MIENEVYLNFTDPEAAYKAAMNKESIRERYPEAKDIGDILYDHWGIIQYDVNEYPSIYDSFECYETQSLDQISDDILDAIAPYVDRASVLVVMAYSEDEPEPVTITFQHGRPWFHYPSKFPELITEHDLDTALTGSCRDIISAHPEEIGNILTEAEIENFLTHISNKIREGLTEYLREEMKRNRVDVSPPINLRFKIEGIIQGKEITDYFAEGNPLDVIFTYKDQQGKKQIIEQNRISVSEAGDDCLSVKLEGIKKAREHRYGLYQMTSEWLEDIHSINSIEIMNAGTSRLSVSDLTISAQDSVRIFLRHGISEKDYLLKNGKYKAPEEKTQNLSR